MKRTEFLKMQPCENPGIDSDDVIAVSQLLESDGEQAVELSLFWKGELRGRYFADSENYYTWIDGKWHTCKMANVVRLCRYEMVLTNDYYYSREWIEWASKEDENRVKDFLHTGLDSYEAEIGWKKQDQAYDRKQRRIDKLMAEVPCVPDEAERWVEETLFPENFLYFQKDGERTTYSCTACGAKSWRKKAWKHREKTSCPKCGRPVTANKGTEPKMKRKPMVILQKYGDKWVERQFWAYCWWEPGKKRIELCEELRAIMQKERTSGDLWYGLKGAADEFEQDFWDTNRRNKRFIPSYLYPGNLDEIMEMQVMKRSALDILAEHGEKIHVNNYIRKFQEYPFLEYFVKSGLYRLVDECVSNSWWMSSALYLSGETQQEILRIDGNRLRRLKELNGGMWTLEWLRYEQVSGKKITKESLEWLNRANVRPRSCQELLDGIGSVNKMVNYLKKQKEKPGKALITWSDYLKMAADEGYDITDSIIRFPRDLKLRHEQLVGVGIQRKDEERLKGLKKLDDQIQHWLPEAMRYSWQDKNYLMIPARSCRELVEEGRTLHHCVGNGDTYMKKMAEGESWILFLRKKEKPEKPYYTIEIDMVTDTIRQWYSELDRKPDREVISKVLHKFKSAIGRKKVRDAIVSIA